MAARFEDYRSDSEVHDIMEKLVERFPKVFDGFEVDSILFIMTQKKKSRTPLKLRSLTYPTEVFAGKPYIVEAFEESWREMTPKQRNLTVFHIMCAFPLGGFDPASKKYAAKVRPDIVMYSCEYAASGGVPNWMENEAACDPMDVEQEQMAAVLRGRGDEDAIPPDGSGDAPTGERHPVTTEGIANLDSEGDAEDAAA